MSILLTEKFNCINQKLLNNPKLKSTQFWEEQWCAYKIVCSLVDKVNELNGGTILISFFNNLYFICVQLLNCFKYHKNSLNYFPTIQIFNQKIFFNFISFQSKFFIGGWNLFMVFTYFINMSNIGCMLVFIKNTRWILKTIASCAFNFIRLLWHQCKNSSWIILLNYFVLLNFCTMCHQCDICIAD